MKTGRTRETNTRLTLTVVLEETRTRARAAVHEWIVNGEKMSCRDCKWGVERSFRYSHMLEMCSPLSGMNFAISTLVLGFEDLKPPDDIPLPRCRGAAHRLEAQVDFMEKLRAREGLFADSYYASLRDPILLPKQSILGAEVFEAH